MASIEVTLARSAMSLTLVQVFLDALCLAHEVGRVLVGSLDKFLQRFDGLLEFLRKLDLFLVLPRVAQCGEPGLKRGHAVLKIGVKFFQFGRELSDLLGIHDGLRHSFILSTNMPSWRHNCKDNDRLSTGPLRRVTENGTVDPRGFRLIN